MGISGIFSEPWHVTQAELSGANATGATPSSSSSAIGASSIASSSRAGQAGKTAATKKTDSVTLSPSGASGALPDFSSYASLGRLSGIRVSTGTLDGQPTGATFAADLMRRISVTDDTDTDALARLESSLARTIDAVGAVYGRDAATAVMGVVYQKIGDEALTEERLGAGFLGAIRLIDKNFGTSAGDAFMADLNDDLNKTMNEFFDNGANEVFYAKGSAAQLDLINERAAQAAEELAEAMGQLMDALSQPVDGAPRKKKSLLEELQEELEAKLQEKLDASRMEEGIAAYEALDLEVESGMLLDMAV